jgi:hypothetical protein
MRLFIAHFILVEESAGLEKSYISSSLFAATCADQAYDTAQSWIQGHEDSTHNAAGELVTYHSTGLYELEEADLDLDRLKSAVTELYGVQVGHLEIALSAESLTPKAKDELAVFRAAQPFIAADGFAAR